MLKTVEYESRNGPGCFWDDFCRYVRGFWWEINGFYKSGTPGRWERVDFFVENEIFADLGVDFVDFEWKTAIMPPGGVGKQNVDRRLQPNAKVPSKCNFCDVFLKATSPLTAICDNLCSPAAWPDQPKDQGPFTNTVRTPIAKAIWGKTPSIASHS